MIAFEVNDMTCGHCANTITKAVKAADPGALVQIDLATHRVQIEASTSDPARLISAIQAVGYTPMAVEPADAGNATPPAPARTGCCCGPHVARR